MISDMLTRARAIKPQLTAWRRALHQIPELGFQENKTTAYLSAELTRLGIPHEMGVGVTGIVGHLGEGGPAVGMRGDMDALPITEVSDQPYASQHPGVMHACGHDGNMTIALGALLLLSQMSERPAGEFRLLLQPSEENQDAEGRSGAVRMIEDGALEGLDYVIGQHVDTSTPPGSITICPGYALANADSFNATVIGHGGHGAHPHETRDPIAMLGTLIPTINAIVSRRIKPLEPAVITIGAVHGGLAGNVIAERVELAGTIRSYSPEVRQQLWDELEAAFGVVRAMGGDYELNIRGGYPATYNDPDVTALIEQATRDLAGDEALALMEPEMGGEDFGLMTAVVPGAMFFTGVSLDGPLRPHHNEAFDLDEEGLVYGAAVMAESALRLMAKASA